MRDVIFAVICVIGGVWIGANLGYVAGKRAQRSDDSAFMVSKSIETPRWCPVDYYPAGVSAEGEITKCLPKTQAEARCTRP